MGEQYSALERLLDFIDPLEAAQRLAERLVGSIHECAPDHSMHEVCVGDLRMLSRLLDEAGLPR